MEIPVYYNDEFKKYMHVFQFPNKKRDVEGQLFIKTLAKSFKIDVALDDLKHYSHDQAISLSGSDEPVKKLSFTSRPLNLSTGFLVGRLQQDGLYLTSLDQISQFYPSLDHLINTIDDSIIAQDAMDHDIVEDAKIVQMSVRTNDDVVDKSKNLEFKRKLEEEKWNKVEWVIFYTKFRIKWDQMDSWIKYFIVQKMNCKFK
jgi:hypothetical protein